FAARAASAESTWVVTWGASPQDAAEDAQQRVRGQTIRQFARISLGGKGVRLRLSNAYGPEPVALGSVRIARQSTGSSIVPGTDRAVTFAGAESVILPPGATRLSDEVALDLPDQADVAISLYIPGEVALRTEHSIARTTTLISAPGDFTARADFPPAV